MNTNNQIAEIDRAVIRIVDALKQTNADLIGGREMLANIEDVEERAARQASVVEHARRQIQSVENLQALLSSNA